MADSIEFRPNQRKIVEALVFLAEREPRIDIFHICKVLYFADRDHFRMYGRPILGDQYCALDDGPIPSLAMNIAKRKEKFVSAEILQYADARLIVDETDAFVRLKARTPFETKYFSRTDIECLTASLKQYATWNFLIFGSLGTGKALGRVHIRVKGPVPDFV